MSLLWGARYSSASFACIYHVGQFPLTPSGVNQESLLCNTRIIGGYPCEKTLPWQAAIFDSVRLYCGGVLISKDWVLTAAHCQLPGITNVRLGEYNLRQLDETEQLRMAAKLIPHPNYNSANKDNDIMLIKLITPVQTNNNVHPIALANSAAPPGSVCQVSGWGTTTSPLQWPKTPLFNKPARFGAKTIY
uniref:Kallikrein-14-like n=1 Tax=Gopherus evgoodei TaxID=1825980 RepID=A0A8C5F1S1_9SAUR